MKTFKYLLAIAALTTALTLSAKADLMFLAAVPFGATFRMKQQFVEGDYAYILWTAETADNVYEVATDTFVVRDGKIVAQSFTGKITPRG